MVIKEIIRGDTNILEFDITEAYDANGNPLSSLAGFSAILQARKSVDDANYVFQKSGTISGMKVIVKIDPADTVNLQANERLLADLQLTDGTNVFTVYLDRHSHDGAELMLIVKPDITR